MRFFPWGGGGGGHGGTPEGSRQWAREAVQVRFWAPGIRQGQQTPRADIKNRTRGSLHGAQPQYASAAGTADYLQESRSAQPVWPFAGVPYHRGWASASRTHLTDVPIAVG